VAARLGLIPESTPVGPSHRLLEAQLPADWDAQRLYDNHEALMLHGQRCCFFQNPACQRCAVLDLCPSGQDRLASLGECRIASKRG
jgi:endonuclease-3